MDNSRVHFHLFQPVWLASVDEGGMCSMVMFNQSSKAGASFKDEQDSFVQ